jgi:hypothetical protein
VTTRDHERGSPTELEQPRTLAEAQHAVAGCRPRQNAPLADWLAYHQRAAAWYAEVAEIDRGHHHEALVMAGRERQLGKDIKAQMSSQRSADDVRGDGR